MNLIKKNISVKGIVVSDIQTNGRGSVIVGYQMQEIFFVVYIKK